MERSLGCQTIHPREAKDSRSVLIIQCPPSLPVDMSSLTMNSPALSPDRRLFIPLASLSGSISTKQTRASDVFARSHRLKHATRTTPYLKKMASGIESSTHDTRTGMGTTTPTEFYRSTNSTSQSR